MIVRYLETGWDDSAFEERLQGVINEVKKHGLEYYDIKISSKGNHCMIIFKEIWK